MTGLGFHDLKMIADPKLSSRHSAEPQAGTTSWLLAAAGHHLLIYLPWFHGVLNRLQFVHGWECALKAEQLCLDYVPVYVEWCYRGQGRLQCEAGWGSREVYDREETYTQPEDMSKVKAIEWERGIANRGQCLLGEAH